MGRARRYICSPPITNNSVSPCCSAVFSASAKVWSMIHSAGASKIRLLVRIMFVRWGSGQYFPKLSKVFRPIRTWWPIVFCLKYFRSSPCRHGIRPLWAITPFWLTAAIKEISISIFFAKSCFNKEVVGYKICTFLIDWYYKTTEIIAGKHLPKLSIINYLIGFL